MNLRELAKQMKVSHTTVSRALNPAQAHLISPAVRTKIQEKAQKMGYSPNPVARALALGRTHEVGVVLPTIFNSLFYNEHLIKTLSGVHQVMKTHDRYNCRVVFPTQEGSLSRLTAKDMASGLDGLLVWNQYVACEWEKADPSGHGLQEDLVNRWKRPLVMMGVAPEMPKGISFITCDHNEAAYQGVRHLIRTQHRAIALIYRDRDFADSRQRYEGYLRALKDHHLTARTEFIKQGDYTRESGYRAALELLNGASKPDAIFCTNDEMAMGAIQAIQALGLRCPNDVAVMGFDGLHAGELISPRLSSVQQPIFDMTVAGMELLVDLIEGRQKAPVIKTIPSRLLVRDSA